MAYSGPHHLVRLPAVDADAIKANGTASNGPIVGTNDARDALQCSALADTIRSQHRNAFACWHSHSDPLDREDHPLVHSLYVLQFEQNRGRCGLADNLRHDGSTISRVLSAGPATQLRHTCRPRIWRH